MASTAQIRHIRYLLNQAGITEDEKNNLVLAYSDGQTSSLKGLGSQPAAELIEALRRAVLSPEQLAADKLRKTIIQIAWQLGWIKDRKIDMDRLNTFILARGAGKAHATLNDYNYNELLVLRNQFISMHKNYVKKA